ncbi:hypothetical protein AB8U03_05840 [Clostridium sp. Mt-5]|uniref:Uncharacterized protein n=1 Tax=Clostridium moutaii TaxID=3240932 RepID=A0ABV4BMK7_9CLOT
MENYYCPFDYYDEDYSNYFRQSVSPQVIQSHVGQTALIDFRGRTVTAHINDYNRRTDIVSLTIFTHSGNRSVRVRRRDILRITPIHVPPPQGRPPQGRPPQGRPPQGRPPQGGGRYLDEDFE